MSFAPGRRGPARRAVDDDAVLAELDLLDVDDDRISVSALVKQAVSAVMVSVLGIVVVGGVSAASAPYSTAVSRDTTSVVGAADTSRAQPTAPAPVEQPGTAPVTTPEEQNADLSTSAIASELKKVESVQQGSVRDASLKNLGEQVSRGINESAGDSRVEALKGTSNAITGEEQRRAAEAARLEAERIAAEKAAEEAAKKTGTLVTQPGKKGTTSSSSTTTTVDPKVKAALASAAASSGGWVTPMAPGAYIRGAGWGAVGSWARYHTGQDLSAAYGTPIRAVGSGVVLGSDGGGWAGINVVIKHADGGQTLYAHMSSKTVQPGSVVQAGQIIGFVGLTGRTFGPHLHFEYYPPSARPGDVYSSSDPAVYMLRHGVRL